MPEVNTINIGSVPYSKVKATDHVEIYVDGERKKTSAGSISDIYALKKKTLNIPSITIGEKGYTEISSVATKPTFESGVEFFMFAILFYYTGGNGVIFVEGRGDYIIGTPGTTYTGVNIAYFYC